MSSPIRLLILEDDPEDADLLLAQLASHGVVLASHEVVSDGAAYEASLGPHLDLIVSDFHLPDFDAGRALTLRNALAPDVPFVVVSGQISDEHALALMRQGADDFLMKDRLSRLGLAAQSAIRRRELEMERTHHRDSVTRLGTRVALLQHIRGRLMFESDATPFGVVYMDVDRFHAINTSYGYERGNRALREISNRLRYVARDDHVLARVGGDAFAVVASFEDEGELVELAEEIHRQLARPIDDVFLSVSIGVAVAQRAHLQAEALLRDAEAAMIQARAAGRAHTRVFVHGLRQQTRHRLETESELRQALERGALHLRYQPVVELRTGLPVGVEALIRWQHPLRGLLGPDAIIPLAEDAGLIVAVGRWVLEEAVRQLVQWRTELQHMTAAFVAVNVAAHQLGDGSFPDAVSGVLDTYGMDSDALVLELTESAMIEAEVPTIASTFSSLRSLGVKLVLDDFGTGYSSLRYLSEVPVDGLKIDRSFVSNPDGQVNEAIVRMIVGLAKSLGLPVTAEGIERDAQRDELLSRDCTFGQGYLFAAPLAAKDVPAFWAAAYQV